MYSYFLPKAVFIINVFKTFLTVQQFDLQVKLDILFTYWQVHEMFGTYRIGGAVPVRGSYDVTAMCLRAAGLRFFSNLSLCGVKQNCRDLDARKSVR